MPCHNSIIFSNVNEKIAGDAQRALFFDRDGVINIDHGYVYRAEDFEFVPGIIELILAAVARGFRIIIVTNQSGIGRGYFTRNDLARLMEWIEREVRKKGGQIDAVYFCPHHPSEGQGTYRQDCSMRKPNPGMILAAQKEFAIDLAKSILVGDSMSDIEAGRAAGVGTLFLFNEKCEDENVLQIDDLSAVAGFLNVD